MCLGDRMHPGRARLGSLPIFLPSSIPPSSLLPSFLLPFPPPSLPPTFPSLLPSFFPPFLLLFFLSPCLPSFPPASLPSLLPPFLLSHISSPKPSTAPLCATQSNGTKETCISSHRKTTKHGGEILDVPSEPVVNGPCSLLGRSAGEAWLSHPRSTVRTTRPAFLPLRYRHKRTHKRRERRTSKGYLDPDICSSEIHSSQKAGTAPMPIHARTDGYTQWGPRTAGTLLRHEKQRSLGTCYRAERP